MAVALLLLTLGASGSYSRSEAAPSEAELEVAERRLAHLRGRLEDLVAEYEAVRDELASAEADVLRTERSVRLIAKRMLAQQDRAADVATELYKTGATIGVEAVLGADSLGDFETRFQYLKRSGEEHVKVFERLARDHRALEDKLPDLKDAYMRARAQRERLAEIRAAVESELAEQQDEVQRLRAAVRRAESREQRRKAAAARRRAEAATQAAKAARAARRQILVPDAPTFRATTSGGADWDAIAECESGGNWSLDSTYDGGLQFDPLTWLAYGGGRYAPYAYMATRQEQIAIAQNVLADQGPSAWPNCFKKK